VYQVGLEGHRILRTPSTQLDDKFGQILFPIRPTKDSNRWKAFGIGKSEGYHFPSGQRQTSRLVAYPAKIGATWLWCPTSPYSPNLAPLDYHLFRSLQNSLNGKNFDFLEDCKNHLEQIIAQKDAKFWENGIIKLSQRWRKVVEQNGTYVID